MRQLSRIIGTILLVLGLLLLLFCVLPVQVLVVVGAAIMVLIGIALLACLLGMRRELYENCRCEKPKISQRNFKNDLRYQTRDGLKRNRT